MPALSPLRRPATGWGWATVVRVKLERVGRRYGRRGPWVLRDVELELIPGSLVRIEGANGSGKSTLLRLLAGIDAPSAGRVSGRPRSVAYVPERFPPALPLTAQGYLTHLARVHGLRGANADGAAERWLTRLGAGDLAEVPLRELSKGSCQKVAVAQALLADPELLVLDEAWTGLDATARDVLDQAVRERVAAGGTAVFVDHDARRLAGAAPTVHRLDGARVLGPAPAPSAEAGAVGEAADETVIVAEGPSGAGPPAGLPGDPRSERLPDGAVRLTVPAAHSDAVLRTLLAGRQDWHIREVKARP